MDETALLEQLTVEGRAAADAVGRGDPSAVAPGLEWDARTVVLHLGAVHRWAADIVRRALPTNETGGSAAFRPDPAPPDAELADWLRDGLSTLVTTLRAAPPDLDCFTFLRGVSPREFWIRRQAHETAVHRIDLEAAAGAPITEVGADFAQDGLRELVGGFATQRHFATSEAGRLLLSATDGASWLVRFGGERTEVSEVGANPPADAVVPGTSDQLYRWAWNRPVNVPVRGDPTVIELWRRIRIT